MPRCQSRPVLVALVLWMLAMATSNAALAHDPTSTIQGHAAEDRPGVELAAPADRGHTNVVLVVETDDAGAEHRRLAGAGVKFLAEPYEPPWGGCRFFCVDPDGYLVEIEQPA